MRRATTTFPEANSTFSTIPISTIDKGTLVAALQGSMIPCRRDITSSCENTVILQTPLSRWSRRVLASLLPVQRRTHHLRESFHIKPMHSKIIESKDFSLDLLGDFREAFSFTHFGRELESFPEPSERRFSV